MNIKVAGAKVKGPNHDVCQDEIIKRKYNNYCIIGVSDGAGSKVYSQYGARAALNGVNTYFKRYFDKTDLLIEEDIVKDDIYNSIMSELLKESNDRDVFLSELACTLLFVVADMNGNYIVCHIGDGGALLLNTSEGRILSYPENGEYKNQTFFITDDDAYEHLHIEYGNVEGPLNAFLICTDGISDLLFRKEEEDVISSVAFTMCSWLVKADASGTAEINAAYEDNLRKHFAAKSQDDLSFCVMVCEK